MDYDQDKIDEVVLALMYLTLHDEVRAWKSFDLQFWIACTRKDSSATPKTKPDQLFLPKKGWPNQKLCSKNISHAAANRRPCKCRV
jgi:hypothetical protein